MPEKDSISIRRIIENALIIVIAALVIAASTIVWDNATSVNDKVNATEAHMTELVENLSLKLSQYEVQLISQSNQLNELTIVCKNLSENKTVTVTYPLPPEFMGPPVAEEVPIEVKIPDEMDPNLYMLEQRALKSDIYEQLRKK